MLLRVFNWEDAYHVARACDLIDVEMGAGDTFRPNGCLMCVVALRIHVAYMITIIICPAMFYNHSESVAYCV